MIELDVFPYCHNCLEFEPFAKTESFEFTADGLATRTTIYCKNRTFCDHIYEARRHYDNMNELTMIDFGDNK